MGSSQIRTWRCLWNPAPRLPLGRAASSGQGCRGGGTGAGLEAERGAVSCCSAAGRGPGICPAPASIRTLPHLSVLLRASLAGRTPADGHALAGVLPTPSQTHTLLRCCRYRGKEMEGKSEPVPNYALFAFI